LFGDRDFRGQRLQILIGSRSARPDDQGGATADATQNFMTNLLRFLVIICNASRTLTCLRTRQSDPRTTFVNA
jgi:hypothetical protein